MSQRNLAASIRARLKQHADARQQDFNLTLTHYGLERLLYRLSISPYADRYLLKGALLFSLWYDQPHRPTRDADLLGFGPDDVESAVAAFREICSVQVEDGLAFDAASVKAFVIRKEVKDYFDLWVLLTEGALDPARLQRAVEATFIRRKLALPKTVPTGLSDAFAQDAAKQRQWAAFLEKEQAASGGPG